MKKFKLRNGLTIIHEPRKTNSVAIEMNIKTGSINETAKTGGISHFIEHLVFKNTKSRTQKEISSTIEDLGGTLDAFTDNERTAFCIQILKKHFDTALEILSDIILNPLFLEKDIEQERNVILREMNIYKDMPFRYQLELLPHTLFKKHPLGNFIIGTRKSVKSITRKQILNYYHKYYVPNNMSIAVSGNAGEPFKKIKTIFKNIKPKPVIKPSPIKVLRITKPIIFRQKRNIKDSYFSIGFKTTSRQSRSSFALDIINTILGEGMSSRFFQEVRQKRGLVYIIRSSNRFIHDTGYFMIYTAMQKKNIPKTKQIIFREIKKIARLTPKELSKAKIKIEGKYLLENEENAQMATAMNYWETNTGKPEMARDYSSQIKKITLNDIRQALRTYFKLNSYSQVIIEGN